MGIGAPLLASVLATFCWVRCAAIDIDNKSYALNFKSQPSGSAEFVVQSITDHPVHGRSAPFQSTGFSAVESEAEPAGWKSTVGKFRDLHSFAILNYVVPPGEQYNWAKDWVGGVADEPLELGFPEDIPTVLENGQPSYQTTLLSNPPSAVPTEDLLNHILRGGSPGGSQWSTTAAANGVLSDIPLGFDVDLELALNSVDPQSPVFAVEEVVETPIAFGHPEPRLSAVTLPLASFVGCPNAKSLRHTGSTQVNISIASSSDSDDDGLPERGSAIVAPVESPPAMETNVADPWLFQSNELPDVEGPSAALSATLIAPHIADPAILRTNSISADVVSPFLRPWDSDLEDLPVDSHLYDSDDAALDDLINDAMVEKLPEAIEDVVVADDVAVVEPPVVAEVPKNPFSGAAAFFGGALASGIAIPTGLGDLISSFLSGRDSAHAGAPAEVITPSLPAASIEPSLPAAVVEPSIVDVVPAAPVVVAEAVDTAKKQLLEVAGAKLIFETARGILRGGSNNAEETGLRVRCLSAAALGQDVSRECSDFLGALPVAGKYSPRHFRKRGCARCKIPKKHWRHRSWRKNTVAALNQKSDTQLRLTLPSSTSSSVTTIEFTPDTIKSLSPQSPAQSIFSGANQSNCSPFSDSLFIKALPMDWKDRGVLFSSASALLDATPNDTIPVSQWTTRTVFEIRNRPLWEFPFAQFDVAQAGLCDEKPEAVFVFITAPKEQKERQLHRETSINVPPNIRRVFIVGQAMKDVTYGTRCDRTECEVDDALNAQVRAEAEQHKDVIIGRFYDTYQNLALKTMSLLRWKNVYCRDAEFVVKMDIDVFPNYVAFGKRFREYAAVNQNANNKLGDKETPSAHVIWRGNPMTGPVMRRKCRNSVSEAEFPGSHYPWYNSGPQYWMSRDVAEQLSAMALRVPFFPVEDALLGICAHLLGLKVKSDDLTALSSRRTADAPAPDDDFCLRGWVLRSAIHFEEIVQAFELCER